MTLPTRAEMAVVVAEEAAEARRNAQALIDGPYPDQRRRGQRDMDAVVIPMEAAVDELRKSCAGCRDYQQRGPVSLHSMCESWGEWVPINGTGYCHNWHAKEATR